MHAGLAVCADGNAYGFAALVLATAIALLVLTIYVAIEAVCGNVQDVRAVAKAVIVVGASAIAAMSLLILTLGVVVEAGSVLFMAFLFLMIDRASDALAVPALILSGGCAACVGWAAIQFGVLFLFLPVAAVVAWAGFAAGLLRLTAAGMKWAAREPATAGQGL